MSTSTSTKLNISQLTCSSCKKSFNEQSRKPRMIINCGHSICTKCLEQRISENHINFTCQVCHQTIKLSRTAPMNQFPINFLVIEMIAKANEEANQSVIEICGLHNSPMELYCLECKKKICNKCMFKSSHKGHEVDLIENLVQEAREKKDKIDSWIKQIDMQYNVIEKMIDGQQNKVMSLLDKKYQVIMQTVLTSQEQAKKQIQSYFDTIKVQGKAQKEEKKQVQSPATPRKSPRFQNTKVIDYKEDDEVGDESTVNDVLVDLPPHDDEEESNKGILREQARRQSQSPAAKVKLEHQQQLSPVPKGDSDWEKVIEWRNKLAKQSNTKGSVGSEISFEDAIRLWQSDLSTLIPKIKDWVDGNQIDIVKKQLKNINLVFDNSVIDHIQRCCNLKAPKEQEEEGSRASSQGSSQNSSIQQIVPNKQVQRIPFNSTDDSEEYPKEKLFKSTKSSSLDEMDQLKFSDDDDEYKEEDDYDDDDEDGNHYRRPKKAKQSKPKSIKKQIIRTTSTPSKKQEEVEPMIPERGSSPYPTLERMRFKKVIHNRPAIQTHSTTTLSSKKKKKIFIEPSSSSSQGSQDDRKNSSKEKSIPSKSQLRVPIEENKFNKNGKNAYDTTFGETNTPPPTISPSPSERANSQHDDTSDYSQDYNTTEITKNTKNIAIIKKLGLNLEKWERTHKSFQGLPNLIWNAQKLKSLDIAFGRAIPPKDILKEVFDSLSKSFDILKLRISFMNSNLLTDEIVKQIASSVQPLVLLETFAFDATQCSKFSESAIADLIEGLSGLKDLKQITMNFDGCAELEENKKGSPKLDISKVIKDHKKLETVQLILKDCILLQNSQCLENICIELTQLRFLKELELSFGKSLITSRGIEFINQTLCNQPQLDNLSLNFTKNFNITNKDLILLVEPIKNMTNLTKLSLQFDSCIQIGNQSCKEIANSIKSLKKIKDLVFGFDDCREITDQGLKDIATSLDQINSVTYFGLFLTNCDQISDESMAEVLKAVGGFKYLERLYLGLDGCTRLGNMTVFELSDSLSFTDNVQEFMLGIEGCTEITEKGIKNVFESINLLKNLKELTLYLSGCKGFSDEALIQLSDNMAGCPKIESLLLELSRFKNLTDTSLDYLSRILVRFKSMKTVNLFMDNCKGLTTEGVVKLLDQMLKMKELKQAETSFLYIPDLSQVRINKSVNKIRNEKKIDFRINLDDQK